MKKLSINALANTTLVLTNATEIKGGHTTTKRKTRTMDLDSFRESTTKG